ncbi:hypothetical protein AB0L57_00785 [Nocardia sp. NPDC052254]|uniref:hypothetical protein n=1 Tax=Nocardia sp. NPDC052254 TaxID=3155681 RepID=UPI0034218B59
MVRATRRPSSEPVPAADAIAAYDCSWVRSSLRQSAHLKATGSLGAEMKRMLDFAIHWAPFGGAGTGELLVAFGVDRSRFVEMMGAGLRPTHADNREAQWLKRALSDALTSAWRINGTRAAGAAS